jgi:hypothetical protein
MWLHINTAEEEHVYNHFNWAPGSTICGCTQNGKWDAQLDMINEVLHILRVEDNWDSRSHIFICYMYYIYSQLQKTYIRFSPQDTSSFPTGNEVLYCRERCIHGGYPLEEHNLCFPIIAPAMYFLKKYTVLAIIVINNTNNNNVCEEYPIMATYSAMYSRELSQYSAPAKWMKLWPYL